MKWHFFLWVVGFALATSLSGQIPSPVSERPVSLGNGVNLGNMLEAPKEGAWGASFQDDYPALNAQAGFKAIRVPIRWATHVGEGPNFTIDPVFLARVDHVVELAKTSQLQVLLDYHNDDELMKDPDREADRFVTTWKQIAEHYRAEPSSILFELLNEPKDKLDGPKWNALAARTITAIRASNPSRTIIVGPVQWNSIGALPKLELPELDRNLLVTVHFYDPMSFTHQGAGWVKGSEKWMGNKWEGSDGEKQAITAAFDKASAWATANHRPIFLGEFGAYDKGEMDSRARWAACVARTAEAHQMPWFYWEFCAGFGVYDPKAHIWRQSLLDALLPK